MTTQVMEVTEMATKTPDFTLEGTGTVSGLVLPTEQINGSSLDTLNQTLDQNNFTSLVNVTKDYPFGGATVMLGYMMPFLLVVTIVTNTLVIAVLSKRHMRTPTNIVLFAMALVDLCTLVIPAPWYFYIYTLGYNKHYLHPPIACYTHYIMTETIPVFFHTSSIWLTLLLASQRYIYVCHPTIARTWCTVPIVKKAINGILLLAFLSQAPRFFDNTFVSVVVNLDSGGTDHACKNEISDWVKILFGVGPFYATYYILRIIFVQIVPCIALIVLNWLLSKALRRAERRRIELLSSRFKVIAGNHCSITGGELQHPDYDRSNTSAHQLNIDPANGSMMLKFNQSSAYPVMGKHELSFIDENAETSRRDSSSGLKRKQLKSTRKECISSETSSNLIRILPPSNQTSDIKIGETNFELTREVEAVPSNNRQWVVRNVKESNRSNFSSHESRDGQQSGAKDRSSPDDEKCGTSRLSNGLANEDAMSRNEDQLCACQSCPICLENLDQEYHRYSLGTNNEETTCERHLYQVVSQCSSVIGGAATNDDLSSSQILAQNAPFIGDDGSSSKCGDDIYDTDCTDREVSSTQINELSQIVSHVGTTNCCGVLAMLDHQYGEKCLGSIQSTRRTNNHLVPGHASTDVSTSHYMACRTEKSTQPRHDHQCDQHHQCPNHHNSHKQNRNQQKQLWIESASTDYEARWSGARGSHCKYNYCCHLSQSGSLSDRLDETNPALRVSRSNYQMRKNSVCACSYSEPSMNFMTDGHWLGPSNVISSDIASCSNFDNISSRKKFNHNSSNPSRNDNSNSKNSNCQNRNLQLKAQDKEIREENPEVSPDVGDTRSKLDKQAKSCDTARFTSQSDSKAIVLSQTPQIGMALESEEAGNGSSRAAKITGPTTATATTTLYSVTNTATNSNGSLLQARNRNFLQGPDSDEGVSNQRVSKRSSKKPTCGDATFGSEGQSSSLAGRTLHCNSVGQSSHFPGQAGSITTTAASLRTIDSNKTTMMLIVVFSVFLLVEVPVTVVTIVHVVGSAFDMFDNVEQSNYIGYIKLLTNFFIAFSYPFNFTIYCSMSKKFRETFWDLFSCVRRSDEAQAQQCLLNQTQNQPQSPPSNADLTRQSSHLIGQRAQSQIRNKSQRAQKRGSQQSQILSTVENTGSVGAGIDAQINKSPQLGGLISSPRPQLGFETGV